MKKAQIINIDKEFHNSIILAKKLFFSGGIFIYPTDTIYGIGANPFNEDAVSKVNVIKGRELGKQYILLVNDIVNLMKYTELNSENHQDFLLSIWPNPVSVILNLNQKTKSVLKRENAAFRIPNNRFCLKITSECNMPIISTSVNRSNQPPMIEPSMLIDEFAEEVDAIFYTEKRSYFESSTIIDLTNPHPELVREGKIKFEEIMKKYEV